MIDAQGYIQSFSAEHIAIQNVTDEGEKDGTSYIESSAITKVDCDTEQEQMLKILFDAIN